MPDFYILVMDRYLGVDPAKWTFSASATDAAALLNLDCFQDPPHQIPRSTFVSTGSQETAIRPCQGGDREHGFVHGIKHV
jgi:hypothetical protein